MLSSKSAQFLEYMDLRTRTIMPYSYVAVGNLGWRKSENLSFFDFIDRTRCCHVIKEDGEVVQRSFCLLSYLLRCIVH